MNEQPVKDRFEKVTDPQKQCLRLVADLMSSKQIARQLDISHHTVDQRLKRAQAILGASGRAEAARMLLNHEATTKIGDPGSYQNLVNQSPDLPHYRYARNEGALIDEPSPSVDSVKTELRDEQMFIFDTNVEAPDQSTLFSALFETNRENRLTIGERVVVMLLIMFTGLIAFALLVNLVEGVSRLV